MQYNIIVKINKYIYKYKLNFKIKKKYFVDILCMSVEKKII